jgi:hypothetical protein
MSEEVEEVAEVEEWYFDLERGIAVPASQRGVADRMLGPYPSKAAAENWRKTVATRNDAWDAEDERWEHLGERRDR